MNIQNWFKNVASKCPHGIALVTGSSRGIGFKLVEELGKNGFAVLPTARSDVQFESKNENIFQTLYLDVTNEKSILDLAHLLKTNEIKINLMVHNTGVLSQQDVNALSLNASILKLVYETNVFGLIETNNKLQNCYGKNVTIAILYPSEMKMQQGASERRVYKREAHTQATSNDAASSFPMGISSTMGHTSRDDYNWATYRLSKRTVIQYARQVALQCKAENKKWKILSLHPGSVQTDMNPNGKISAQQSVKNIIKLFSNEMSKKLLENNGGFGSCDETAKEWKLLSTC